MKSGRNFGNIHKGPATVPFSLTLLVAQRPPVSSQASSYKGQHKHRQPADVRGWPEWDSNRQFQRSKDIRPWQRSRACRDSSRPSLARTNTHVDSAATVSDVHVHRRWKCCSIYRLFNDVVSSVDVWWLKHNELERLWQMQLRPNIRCCQGIHFKEMSKATKYVSHESWSRPTFETITSWTKFRSAFHFSHRDVWLTTK